MMTLKMDLPFLFALTACALLVLQVRRAGHVPPPERARRVRLTDNRAGSPASEGAVQHVDFEKRHG